MPKKQFAIWVVLSALAMCLCEAVPARAQGTYQWSMVAQATPDECFQGNVNNAGGITAAQQSANNASFAASYPAGLTATQIASCISAGYLPKINQSYVWGMTMDSTGNLWLGTAANVLCLVDDNYFGSVPAPTQDGDYVCDAQQNPTEDYKPPRMFMYAPTTNQLTDVTGRVLLAGTPVGSGGTGTDLGVINLLKGTFGLRSAGYYNGVVFFGGIYSNQSTTPATADVIMFAFNASTMQYLGHYLFDGSDAAHPWYNDMRQWHVINNNLFAGVGQRVSGANNGVLLRWTGSLAAPFSFVDVGETVGEIAYFTGHSDGHIYATTWGAGGNAYGMNLYMSPLLHGATGLDATDAANWTAVWNLDQYEVEPSALQVGGAIASYGGYLYFGTMQMPGTSSLYFANHYPTSTLSATTVALDTLRPITIFRTLGYDPTAQPTPSMELLYGSTTLNQYNPATDTFTAVPNGMGATATYGAAGFGNMFNNYTWSMAVFQNQLYVGTMDFSYLLGTSPTLSLPAAIQTLAATFYGADLWTFPNTTSAATYVNLNGMGNDTSYGIRNMLTDSTGLNLWLGMANPMNLRSDMSNNPGGWKLIDFPAAQNGAPIITWYNPASIVYGTPLTATQLDATATVDGVYTYTPPLGTVLPVGANQVLSMTFAPFSSGNVYGDTAKITVTPAPLVATAANATMVYGTNPPTPFTGTLTGVVNNDGITATYVAYGPSPAVGVRPQMPAQNPITSTTPSGTYVINPVLADPKTRLSNYSVTLTPGTLTITQAGTATTVWANAPTVYPLVLTAQVISSTTGTPTGTVTFYDGNTAIGTGTLASNGLATLSLTTLASGPHSISAVYQGDTNFSTSTAEFIPVTGIPFLNWSTPAGIVYGTPLTVAQLNATANQPGTFTYVPAIGTVLSAGNSQVLTATFTPLNSSNTYSANVNINVAKAPLVVTAANVGMTYGTPVPAPLTGTLVSVVNNDGITATYATTGTATSTAGTYPITPTLVDPNTKLANYAVTIVPGVLTISKAGTIPTIAESLPTVLLQNAETFTAHVVTATTGTPTGTVTFYDGTTAIGTGTLNASGFATLTISTLALGTHNISFVYPGDANFVASSSPTITEVEQDFQFTITNTNVTSATVMPGSTATYGFTIAPTNGTYFPNAVTLTLSGLPNLSTGTITPQTIAVGNGATPVIVTVQTAPTVATNFHSFPGGLTYAVIFLPVLGLLTLRKRARGLGLLMMVVLGLAIMVGTNGCGGSSGLFAVAPQTSTITVTGTCGTLTHSTTLSLTVQ